MHRYVLMSFFLLAMGHGFAFGTEIVAVSKSEQGTYYVPLVFGSGNPGQPIESLVDTGSGLTTVPPSVIEDLLARNEATLTRELTGILASGEMVTVPVYTITMLQLGECRFRDVEVAVFPDRTSAILGLNILKQLGSITFSFTTEPPHLAVNCAGKW